MELRIATRRVLYARACMRLLVSMFPPSRSRARNRFAVSIIVRFFSCFLIGTRAGRTRASAPGAVTPGNRMWLLRICNAQTLRTLRSGARVSRSVFAPILSGVRALASAQGADKASAMQPWEERTGRDSSRLRAFPRFCERPIPRATSRSFSTKSQHAGPTSSGCVAARRSR